MEWNTEENFSLEWNMEENFSVEWNMEWKKIASMEYGKIVFHSISYHALTTTIYCSGLMAPLALVGVLCHSRLSRGGILKDTF